MFNRGQSTTWFKLVCHQESIITCFQTILEILHWVTRCFQYYVVGFPVWWRLQVDATAWALKSYLDTSLGFQVPGR